MRLLAVSSVLLLGCPAPTGGGSSSPADPTLGDSGAADDSGGADSGDTGGTDTGGTDTGPRLTATGDVTWSVDFGATSEASGLADCAYTRHYTGGEDRSAPWLCPDCEVVFKLDTTVVSGREDCYDLISPSAPPATEYLGYGGGVWYRGAGSWLTERGPVEVDETGFAVTQDVSSDATGEDYGFHIEGALTFGHDDGDPYGGYTAPESYACGWPKADPPAYTGAYAAEVGETLPDGTFTDICDEPVRLHDFAGSWLIVDISAMDCGPCQQAADSEEAFRAELDAAGIPVQVVTLLAPSLSDTAGTPTHKQLQMWIDTFALTTPVLADRVWGLSVVGKQIPDDFGYPTFVVVNPDLQIVDVQVGFGGWDSFVSTIEAANP